MLTPYPRLSGLVGERTCVDLISDLPMNLRPYLVIILSTRPLIMNVMVYIGLIFFRHWRSTVINLRTNDWTARWFSPDVIYGDSVCKRCWNERHFISWSNVHVISIIIQEHRRGNGWYCCALQRRWFIFLSTFHFSSIHWSVVTVRYRKISVAHAMGTKLPWRASEKSQGSIGTKRPSTVVMVWGHVKISSSSLRWVKWYSISHASVKLKSLMALSAETGDRTLVIA